VSILKTAHKKKKKMMMSDRMKNENGNIKMNDDDNVNLLFEDEMEPDLADMPEPETEPDEPFACTECGEDVCEWMQMQPFICMQMGVLEPPHCDDDKAERSRARKFLYRALTMHLYGPLGKGNRVQLATCILAGVRGLYPDPHEEYMGHKDR
jgi:hypothetical protein